MGKQGMLMQSEIGLLLSEHVKQDAEEKISFTKSSRAWGALCCLGPSSSDEVILLALLSMRNYNFGVFILWELM